MVRKKIPAKKIVTEVGAMGLSFFTVTADLERKRQEQNFYFGRGHGSINLEVLESTNRDGRSRRLRELVYRQEMGDNLRVTRIVYETMNDFGTTESLDLKPREYVAMGRPRYLRIDVKTTFTKRETFPREFLDETDPR